MFSAVDLLSGYYQILCHPDDRDYTTFTTRRGNYRWKVMSQGLCNAPATFMRLMNRVLQGLEDFALVYLDDIIIYSSSVVEHCSHLEQVFDRLRQAGLKMAPFKCHFAMHELVFLGHLVDARGTRPDPGKLEALRQLAPPRNVSEIRSAPGLFSYYRRFVYNFAEIARPMTALLKKDAP